VACKEAGRAGGAPLGGDGLLAEAARRWGAPLRGMHLLTMNLHRNCRFSHKRISAAMSTGGRFPAPPLRCTRERSATSATPRRRFRSAARSLRGARAGAGRPSWPVARRPLSAGPSPQSPRARRPGFLRPGRGCGVPDGQRAWFSSARRRPATGWLEIASSASAGSGNPRPRTIFPSRISNSHARGVLVPGPAVPPFVRYSPRTRRESSRSRNRGRSTRPSSDRCSTVSTANRSKSAWPRYVRAPPSSVPSLIHSASVCQHSNQPWTSAVFHRSNIRRTTFSFARVISESPP
jgi:hypothetical protein